MENKKFIIRKVPLKKFVSLLNELYMSGADFVDLHGKINRIEKQDNVTVTVPIEYMSEESQENEEHQDMMEPGPQPPPGIEEEELPPEITEEEIVDLLKHV